MVYFSSILVIISIFIVGRLFLVKFLGNKIAGWPLAFFLGTGVLGIFSQTLLVLGVYKKVYVVIFVLACCAYFIFLIKKNLSFSNIQNSFVSAIRRVKDFTDKHDIYLIISISVAVLILIILNFVPITTGDAINYHFPFIKDFILSGRIHYPIAGITQWGLGFMPALADIINASFVLLTGSPTLDIPLALFQSAILIAFLIFSYSASEIFIKNKSARLLIPLLFLSMPDIWYTILSVGMIDLLLVSFIFCGLFIFYKWIVGRDNSFLYLTAFFLGSAAAMKYLTLLVLAYCLVVYFAMIFYKRIKGMFLPSLYLAAIFIFISSYWYIRNSLVFHNPVYPLLSHTDINSQLSKENLLPQTWWLYILYPVLAYASFLFSNIASRFSVVEFLTAIFATVGSIIVLWQSGKKDKTALIFVASSFFYSWIISEMGGSIRYNLPAFISLIAASAVVVDRLIDKIPKITEKIWVRTAVVAFIFTLIFNINIYKRRIPMIFGSVSKDVYIRKELGKSYSMEEYKTYTQFLKK